MKYNSKEIKIGITGIITVCILVVGINFLKGTNVFQSTDTYFVHFENVMGMPISSPIFADGVKVGTVKDITYNRKRAKDIIVKIDIEKGLRIPQGSSAEIETDMLGGVKVNLLLGHNPRAKFHINDTIPGNVNLGMMARISKDVMPHAQKLLVKLDTITTALQHLLTQKSLEETLVSTRNTMRNLEKATASLNLLLKKQIPEISNNLVLASNNAAEITNNLKKVDFSATMKKIDATLSGVKKATAQLNSKQGTLGLLLSDSTLYNNLLKTTNHMSNLLIDLKEHPKRYVHFSIFGRKNKKK